MCTYCIEALLVPSVKHFTVINPSSKQHRITPANLQQHSLPTFIKLQALDLPGDTFSKKRKQDSLLNAKYTTKTTNWGLTLKLADVAYCVFTLVSVPGYILDLTEKQLFPGLNWSKLVFQPLVKTTKVEFCLDVLPDHGLKTTQHFGSAVWSGWETRSLRKILLYSMKKFNYWWRNMGNSGCSCSKIVHHLCTSKPSEIPCWVSHNFYPSSSEKNTPAFWHPFIISISTL